ncbi:MAG: DUF4097 family beta strand repeat protein [Clostridia bacterium]|nr:DUF4097 family beta strand repeat protein [Clostridia bacterium]
MIRKIIGAVSLFITFIVTFAIGVGCIIRGAGDFSWDIVSEYVSMSDIVMINDTPVSNLFSFSDHSAMMGSHAEGQIDMPSGAGTIEIVDIPVNLVFVVSSDEQIHLTFDGDINKSCVVKSAANLEGTNIPDIEFAYNDSTDKAVIRFRNFRTRASETPRLTIAIPANYAGAIKLEDVAGKAEGDLPLSLTKVTIKNVAGNASISDLTAPELKISDVAGKVELEDGKFQTLTVEDGAGKVIVSGSVGSFDVHGIAGKVEISSDIPLADDCAIRNIMGDVSVTLPKGCAFKVKKDDVVGVVIAKGSKKGEHTVTIENIMGKVSILNTNA